MFKGGGARTLAQQNDEIRIQSTVNHSKTESFLREECVSEITSCKGDRGWSRLAIPSRFGENVWRGWIDGMRYENIINNFGFKRSGVTQGRACKWGSLARNWRAAPSIKHCSFIIWKIASQSSSGNSVGSTVLTICHQFEFFWFTVLPLAKSLQQSHNARCYQALHTTTKPILLIS